MRIHLWNTLLSLFFAVLMVAAIWWLFATGRLFYQVPFRDLLLLALATYRLIRLFTYDIITKFIRDWFAGARENSLGGTLGALLNCPWCTGLWFSFLVVFSYFATPYAWPVIIILAVAGIASFFMTLSNLIGWMAEGRKLDVHSRFGE
ncbi:MAG: sporulation protein [Parcubacteria group bacterium]|nr:sporulation protein [Parcubacteria group bacterium]